MGGSAARHVIAKAQGRLKYRLEFETIFLSISDQ